MKRNNFWKTVFVIFVVLWALWEIYPPTSTNLIDEFVTRAVQTDTNFTAIVKRARQLQHDVPDRTYGNLRAAIGTNSIIKYFPFIKIAGQKDPTQFILGQLQKEAQGKIKLGLDLQGGTSFLVEMDTNKLAQVNQKDRALSEAISVLRRRLDRFGVAEPILQPVGNNQILIQMPGLSEEDKQSARAQIQRAAFLEFRLVNPKSDQILAERPPLIPPGYEVLTKLEEVKNGPPKVYPYVVSKKPARGLTGKYVSQAGVSRDLTGRPEINLTFDSKGAELFADITRANVGHQLAIVLDGQLYSAPVIETAIETGRAVINGDFTPKEAFELANVLENPLEAPVHITEERGVDPSLGKDSIRSGIKASIIGTIAVVVFMAAYYLQAGLVANVALLLNIIILMGVMASIDTTLTLPGIAGIVLTIGMAVDANVLIFERIREELAAGKSMRGALAAGYDKAFGTIFDANLTTLISSVILIFMGSGPVKGFGVTLTIGVIVSMFTALVVTRIVFDWLLEKNILSFKMLHIVRGTKIKFLDWWKPSFALSWTLAIVGISYGLYRGSDAVGVDFAGGDSLLLTFNQKVGVDKLRHAITALGYGAPQIQYQTDISSGQESLHITTAFNSGDAVFQALKKDFPSAHYVNQKLDKVGPTVGHKILKSAVISVILALFGILFYVAMRYEFSFAVGAVLAVIHDVFMTMGWFCLTGREFSAPMVAAILTIIGFSINDTIVIFDRIREDLKLGVRGSFKELMDGALNKTLSRTLLTSGTVFLSTLALYIFGGGVINDFAFTFLVGIITGTYSSIYIASAIVLWWHKGERPRVASQVVMEQSAAARA